MDIINEKFNDIEEHLLKMNNVKKMINSLAKIQTKISEIKINIKEVELKKLLKAEFNNYEKIIDTLRCGEHTQLGEMDGYNFTLCNIVFTYSIPNMDKFCECYLDNKFFIKLCINHKYTLKAKIYHNNKNKFILDDDIIKKFMAVAVEYNISTDLYFRIVQSICCHFHFDEEYYCRLNNYETKLKINAYSKSNQIWSQIRNYLEYYTQKNIVSNMNIFYQSENDNPDSG